MMLDADVVAVSRKQRLSGIKCFWFTKEIESGDIKERGGV